MTTESRFREFLTIREVAEILGISERQVWRIIREGLIKAHKFGRSTRVKRSDLDDYIRSQAR